MDILDKPGSSLFEVTKVLGYEIRYTCLTYYDYFKPTCPTTFSIGDAEGGGLEPPSNISKGEWV